MQDVTETEEFKEAADLMREPSERKMRRGTRQWINRHEKRDVILALVDLFIERRGTTGAWGYDEFVGRILKEQFDYPFEPSAFRMYLTQHHASMRRS